MWIGINNFDNMYIYIYIYIYGNVPRSVLLKPANHRNGKRKETNKLIDLVRNPTKSWMGQVFGNIVVKRVAPVLRGLVPSWSWHSIYYGWSRLDSITFRESAFDSKAGHFSIQIHNILDIMNRISALRHTWILFKQQTSCQTPAPLCRSTGWTWSTVSVLCQPSSHFIILILKASFASQGWLASYCLRLGRSNSLASGVRLKWPLVPVLPRGRSLLGISVRYW